MKPKITVIGSSNTDMIVRVPYIPKPGETVLGGEFSTASGGKGANQAVAAAKAGGDVTFIARVGGDSFGEQAIAGYKNAGIRTDFISLDKNKPTGIAQILVADNGENSIAVASGANGMLSPNDVKTAETEIARSKILLLQLEIPLETVEFALELSQKLGNTTILNPAPAAQLSQSVFHRTTILTPNETEAEILTGIKVTNIDAAKKSANKLLEKGVEKVIITLGENGVLFADEESCRHMPAFKVKAIDTTAAGDVFNGALAVALAEGKSMIDAIRFGCAASALSVQKPGAQPSIPNRQEINEFFNSDVEAL